MMAAQVNINKLKVLLLANQGHDIPDIAEILKLSDMTINRYLMALRRAGYKIHCIKNRVELWQKINHAEIESTINLLEKL